MDTFELLLRISECQSGPAARGKSCASPVCLYACTGSCWAAEFQQVCRSLYPSQSGLANTDQSSKQLNYPGFHKTKHKFIHNLSIYRSIYQSIYRSIYQSIYRSIYQSIYRSIYRSIDRSIHISIHRSIHLSIYRSIDLSIYLSIYLAIYLSIHPSIYLSPYLPISLCIYLSIYLYLSI